MKKYKIEINSTTKYIINAESEEKALELAKESEDVGYKLMENAEFEIDEIKEK